MPQDCSLCVPHISALCGSLPYHCPALQRETLEAALKQLFMLDAIDLDGKITPLGRQMVSLPLEPSLARTLIAAAQLGCLQQALTVAAMLSADSIFYGKK